ncbi:ABC transporter permease [Streptomyces sp. NPDC055709]
MSVVEVADGVAAAVARRARRDAGLRVVLGVAVPVVLTVAWQFAARTGAVDVLLFPPPSRIVSCWADLAATGELGEHLRATLARLLPGFVSGAAAGIVAGFAMGCFRPVNAALGPLFTALYCVPKIATLPMLLLVFGLTETPRILSVAITVFFVVQINTLAGVRQIDARTLEAARSYGAAGLRMIRFILLPGACPAIMTGLRAAAGLSVVVVVAVEFVASDAGLGYLIWNSWTLFQPDRMYAGIATVALTGALFSALLALAERWATPWRHDGRRLPRFRGSRCSGTGVPASRTVPPPPHHS